MISMAVLTPFFDVVAGVAILAGRSSLLDTGIFKTANNNFTVRQLLALGFIGYGGWNLWKIERAQDKLKKSLGAEDYTEIGICDYGLVCDQNIPTPLNEYGICQECQEQWEYENEMFPLEKGAEDYTEIGICDYGLVCDQNIPTPLNEYGICQECQEQWEYENEMFPLEEGAESFEAEGGVQLHPVTEDFVEYCGRPNLCVHCGLCLGCMVESHIGSDSMCDTCGDYFLDESFGADGHYLRKSKYDDNGRWDIYWEGDSRYRNYAITLKDNPNDIRIVVEYGDDTGYSLAIPQPDTIKNFSTMNEVLEYLDNMGDVRIGVFTHRFSTNRSYPTVGDWGAESFGADMTQEDLENLYETQDVECNECGGILNPHSSRGPYKKRQLCDCVWSAESL